MLFLRKRKRKELTFTEKNKQKERKYIKERKKRKKEFFLIRQPKEKERSQRARVCVCTHRQDSPRPFAAFKITTNDREKPLTVFSSRPLFCFLNNDGKPVFCFRVSEPTLFCFLNRKPDRARSPYACACVCICTQPHPPPTSENSQQMRVCHFQALQGTYKPFYGRDR